MIDDCARRHCVSRPLLSFSVYLYFTTVCVCIDCIFIKQSGSLFAYVSHLCDFSHHRSKFVVQFGLSDESSVRPDMVWKNQPQRRKKKRERERKGESWGGAKRDKHMGKTGKEEEEKEKKGVRQQ